MTINLRSVLAIAAALAAQGGIVGEPYTPPEYRPPRLPKSMRSKPATSNGGKAAIQYANRYQSVPMLSTRERARANRRNGG